MSWALHLYDPTNTTLVAELDPELHGVGWERTTWQRVGNDRGKGTFALPMDSPVTPERGQVVRCLLNGSADFAWRIRGIRTVPVTDDEDAGRVRVFSGPGLLADWSGAVVRPPYGASSSPAWGDRVLGWMSADFDSTAWPDAVLIGAQGWDSTFYTGLPAGWRDGAAAWIAGPGDTEEDADAGYRYLVQAINFTSPVAQPVLWLAGDNEVIAWFDEHKVGSDYDYRESAKFELDQPISAGWHILAIRLENAPDDGPPGGNPTAALWSITEGVDGAVVARSSTTMRCLTLPAEPPGMTWGEVIALLAGENECLDAVTLNFTATVDSSGDDWEQLPEHGPYGIGTTLEKLLRSAAEASIDFEVRPDGSLDNWIKGNRGDAATLSLVTYDSTAGQADPSLVNVAELEWEHDDTDGFDALLVDHKGGRFVTPDPVPDGGRVHHLKLDTDDPARALAVAEQLLDLVGDGVEVATLRVDPTSTDDYPGGSWDLWDIVEVPSADDPDITVPHRVTAYTVTIDENGDPEFIPELGSLVLERSELVERTVTSLTGGGALGGRAESAGAAAAASAAKRPGGVSEVPIGSVEYPTAGRVIDGFNVPQPCRVNALRLKVMGGSGTVTVTVTRNGATVATLSGAAPGEAVDIDTSVDLVSLTTDEWAFTIDAPGAGERLSVWISMSPLRT